MDKKKLTIIRLSLENDQCKQMVEFIEEYGTYDFFSDFKQYLADRYINPVKKYEIFSDCVINYHKIIGR